MSTHKWKFLLLFLVVGSMAAVSAQAANKASLREQAWDLLRAGVDDEKVPHRATAVRVLSLLAGEPEAKTLACKALEDEKPEVRAAGAWALGQLHATSTIRQLKKLLADKEVSVVLAAANALLQMKDKTAYAVYYAILTGKRKASKGLVEEQLDRLKDPKKVALLGFEEGIGFIPFAGMGYTAVKTLVKDDSSPVRAAAAKVLSGDLDPDIDQTLIDIAINDKSEIVRVAALDAIARRNHSAMIEKVAPIMNDDSDPVKYTAAAAILKLTDHAGMTSNKKKSSAQSAPQPASPAVPN
jgi:HEAT repeat protein